MRQYTWVISQTSYLIESDFPAGKIPDESPEFITMSRWLDLVVYQLNDRSSMDRTEYYIASSSSDSDNEVNEEDSEDENEEESDNEEDSEDEIEPVNELLYDILRNEEVDSDKEDDYYTIKLVFDNTEFYRRNFQTLYYKIMQFKHHINSLVILNGMYMYQKDERNDLGVGAFRSLMDHLSKVNTLEIIDTFPLGNNDPFWQAVQETRFDTIISLTLNGTNYPVSMNNFRNFFASDLLKEVIYQCAINDIPKHNEYFVHVIKAVCHKPYLHTLFLHDIDPDAIIDEEDMSLHINHYLEDSELVILPELKVLSLGLRIHPVFLLATRIHDWIIKQTNVTELRLGLSWFVQLTKIVVNDKTFDYDTMENSHFTEPSIMFDHIVGHLPQLIKLRIYGSVDFMVVGANKDGTAIYDPQYRPYKTFFTHPRLENLRIHSPPRYNPRFNDQLLLLVKTLVKKHRNSVRVKVFKSDKIENVKEINDLLKR